MESEEPKERNEPKLSKVVAIAALTSLIVSLLVSGFFFLGAIFLENIFPEKTPPLLGKKTEQPVEVIKEESAITKAVKKVSPAVVSIIISKDLPRIEESPRNPFGNEPFFREFFRQFFDTPDDNPEERQEISGGTGFIISSDGLILTNKHVVADTEAQYAILTNDGKKYEAKVVARDPTNDIALLEIERTNLSAVELGDSSVLEIGQTVIAIGNALGEYRNTVSVGVISGLSRSITAGDSFIGQAEQLSGVIQTDAAINPGNSGGPLINIKGQVIGINTAIVQGAQNIGFAIPINDAKYDIRSVQKEGRIVRPLLGVRYLLINKSIQERNNLPVDYGALVSSGNSDPAVIPDSPAQRGGIKENDIILEVDGKKITTENPLAKVILSHNIGDVIELKILRKDEEIKIKVKLDKEATF